MRSFSYSGHVIGASIGMALLAACGGSQRPIGAPGAMPQSRAIAQPADRPGSWMLPKAKGENLIYIAGVYNVFIFNVHGKQVGSIDLLADPGVCADARGDVWVTYFGSVMEYAHGGTTPINELNAPYPYTFVSCAVDPVSGNIGLTIDLAEGTGGVAVFQNASGTPTTYTDSDFRYYQYCSYDGTGNLFVDGLFGRTGQVILGEIAAHANSMETIELNQSIGRIGGVAWDGEDLALGDSGRHVVYQVSVSDGQGTLVGSIPFRGWKSRDVDFWIHNGTIGFVSSLRYFGIWKYPAGHHAVRKFVFNYATPGGTAFSAAQPRNRATEL